MRPRLSTLPHARAIWAAWWRQWRAVARSCGIAVAVAIVAYLACFPITRPVTLDVGRFPDRLAIAGFNGDERDNGVTYRWTRTTATIAIPGYGGVRKAHVEIVARNGRADGGETPFTVDIGGDAATVGAFTQFNPVLADLTASGTAADLTVRLRADRIHRRTAIRACSVCRWTRCAWNRSAHHGGQARSVAGRGRSASWSSLSPSR